MNQVSSGLYAGRRPPVRVQPRFSELDLEPLAAPSVRTQGWCFPEGWAEVLRVTIIMITRLLNGSPQPPWVQ